MFTFVPAVALCWCLCCYLRGPCFRPHTHTDSPFPYKHMYLQVHKHSLKCASTCKSIGFPASSNTHAHILSALRQQDMASPGLKPALFFLALDTAKPSGGYAATQWSNGAGPTLSTEHKEIHRGHFSIHLHLRERWNRIGHSANVRLRMKRKDTAQ